MRSNCASSPAHHEREQAGRQRRSVDRGVAERLAALAQRDPDAAHTHGGLIAAHEANLVGPRRRRLGRLHGADSARALRAHVLGALGVAVEEERQVDAHPLVLALLDEPPLPRRQLARLEHVHAGAERLVVGLVDHDLELLGEPHAAPVGVEDLERPTRALEVLCDLAAAGRAAWTGPAAAARSRRHHRLSALRRDERDRRGAAAPPGAGRRARACSARGSCRAPRASRSSRRPHRGSAGRLRRTGPRRRSPAAPPGSARGGRRTARGRGRRGGARA